MASFSGDSWVLPDDAVDVPYPTPGAPPIPSTLAPATNSENHFQLPADAVDVPHPKAITETSNLNPGVAESDKAGMNLATGLANSVGNLIGTPNSIARLGEYISGKLGYPTDAISRHLLSPQEINDSIAKSGGLQSPEMAFMPNPTSTDRTPIAPYKPETPAGEFAQSLYSTAPLAMVGGGGLPAMIARQAANAAGVGSGEAAKAAFPDYPSIQLAAGLLGSFAGDVAVPTMIGTATGAVNTARKLYGSNSLAEKTATQSLVNAANMSRGDLADQIDKNLPQWRFADQDLQPKPTTDTVVQNPGLLNMTYADQAAARQSNDARYWQNAQDTNAAQRQALERVSPDLEPQMTQARSDLTGQVAALPTGVTAQDAGSQFRAGLQGVYDQRFQARQQLGNNVFDALDSSPAQISLQPVRDYATEMAAKNAGEVGNAYQAAGKQFQSGTGITLDTAPFANSVLKGLGDLAGSYPPGSAAQRAVQDVKSRAEAEIFTQEPSIGAARKDYADASRPLDVFDPKVTPGPIANAVQTTRFGGYVTPNDSVTAQFLRSPGSADAIDRLNSVFGDVKSATGPLQDHIASQVAARAMNPDGTVNLNAMQTVLQPFQNVLGKLPFAGLKKQFSDVTSAQQAVDQLAARQKLVDTLRNNVNTGELDSAGNKMLSPAKFDGFVQKNRQDIATIYGQDGAARIDQINEQLQQAAQTARARVPGQSGTPQVMNNGAQNVLDYVIREAIGRAGGAALGLLSGGTGHVIGGEAVGELASLGYSSRIKKFNSAVQEVTRNALLDPTFAKYLLTNYNVKMPTPAGRRALDYVQNHAAGYIAPELR